MSPEVTLERALSRFGDRIYRLALLLNSRPEDAAKATATAFRTFDWTTTLTDDQIEQQLLTALPRPARRRRMPTLEPLSATFWQLSATTRLAVGLRLTRGYTSDRIASVLGTSPDAVRRNLLHALAGVSEPDADPECDRLQQESLDDPLVGRVHRLTCTTCRSITSRVTEIESILMIAIEQATGRLHLPKATEQQIVDGFRRRNSPPRSQRPKMALVPIAALVVAVLIITTMLILPRSSRETQAMPPTQEPQTAEDVLTAVISRYGSPVSSAGILHQRYQIRSGQPAVTYLAETWTDATNPGRHRMQITVDNVLQEWQSGDGASTLRYVSNGSLQNCGRTYPDSQIRAGQINRWEMNTQDQAMMRTSRWQYGPWGIGRYYLEQAQNAEQLRSLGTVVENGNQILTLAAQDAEIDGTLLLKLDADDLTLNAVHLIVIDQGTSSTLVPWQLISSEQSTLDTVTGNTLFSTLPVQQSPREYNRPLPILDPACPLWDRSHAYSLTSVIKQGTTPVVGLSRVPTGIERVYLAGRRRMGGQVEGENDYLRLIYVGAGKRLTLLALPNLITPGVATALRSDTLTSGQWRINLRTIGIAGLRGDARPATADSSMSQPAFWFVAEGWSESEVLALLADVHTLDLSDINAQRSVLYEPGPLTSAAGAASTID